MSDYAIDVSGLRKSFGDIKVVEGLSLKVAEGEICGFLGANGRTAARASASATTSSPSRTKSAARSAT